MIFGREKLLLQSPLLLAELPVSFDAVLKLLHLVKVVVVLLDGAGEVDEVAPVGLIHNDFVSFGLSLVFAALEPGDVFLLLLAMTQALVVDVLLNDLPVLLLLLGHLVEGLLHLHVAVAVARTLIAARVLQVELELVELVPFVGEGPVVDVGVVAGDAVVVELLLLVGQHDLAL